jgi:hypothetical protein
MLCVIKQLHSTQRVSMTTKRLIGKLHKETAIVTMLVPLAARCLIASTSSHRNSKLSEEFPLPIYYPLGSIPDLITDKLLCTGV